LSARDGLPAISGQTMSPAARRRFARCAVRSS
jgi:hypothetical protein